MNKELEFKNPKDAFVQAITNKTLSANAMDQNYIEGFMYMYTKDGVDYFKNIITRKYGFYHQTILGATS